MTIAFMFIGAARSGTAWCANWTTTERTLCLHEPLIRYDLDQLDSIPCDRMLGLADTGIALFPDFLAHHPARKVVVHRDLREIATSLRRAGLPPLEGDWEEILRNVPGLHINWGELFVASKAAMIHRHLFGRDYDPARHELLTQLNVQADFEKLDPDPAVCKRLIQRMTGDIR